MFTRYSQQTKYQHPTIISTHRTHREKKKHRAERKKRHLFCSLFYSRFGYTATVPSVRCLFVYNAREMRGVKRIKKYTATVSVCNGDCEYVCVCVCVSVQRVKKMTT